MYRVFNMGHRLEIYLPEEYAAELISSSKSFNVDAQVVGRVESLEGKKLNNIKTSLKILHPVKKSSQKRQTQK